MLKWHSANAGAGRDEVKIVRWRGGQHPTFQTISRLMEKEGLRPYSWWMGPSTRHAVRSHGYNKVLYCIEGAIEVILPDINQRVVLRPGDRIDLPRGVRYALYVGATGARCAEGEIPTLLS